MQLNQNPHTEIPFNKFKGGYAGAKAKTTLDTSEAQDLNNIVLLPDGSGFRVRNGTQQISPVGGSSQNAWSYVLGVYTYRQSVPGTVTTANNPLRVATLAKATAQSGGFDVVTFLDWQIDGTSSPALTSRDSIYYTGSTVTKDFRYGITTFNNSLIITSKKGGDLTVGSLPAKCPLTLSALTALGGSAPQGDIILNWNNRLWIGNTTSDPSKLYYSILNDETDWTSSGSGFVNPDPKSGDELTAVTPISNNVLLLFKQNKIFQVVGRSDPFSVFELFRDIGCVGKDAFVNVDGVVYFINTKAQMRITDGTKIYTDVDIPQLAYADDLWSQIDVDRRTYIRGARQRGKDYDWIVWLCALGSGVTNNNYAIVWDLKNKCWLRNTGGYIANCITNTNEGTCFMGSYDGARIFQADVTSFHKDDPTGTAIYNGNNRIIAPTDSSAVSWKWRTDDISLSSVIKVKQVSTVNVISLFSGSGTLSMTYRYDGNTDSSAISKTITPGSLAFTISNYRPLGRGVTFGCELSGSSLVDQKINSFSVVGTQKAVKDSGVV